VLPAPYASVFNCSSSYVDRYESSYIVDIGFGTDWCAYGLILIKVSSLLKLEYIIITREAVSLN
jgi:hypothetical protein